ncbi:MAG: hypothetical protein JST57_06715 [Bacteroidetes bacterium]|nr:hypothetical protein [Ferruginibacter sp.]MBS1908287.1 hypothetical protein [Bacteroidota bacterium]MBS1925676.1 hypothetical protein [Bacteroidota bacterium]MCC6692288.1 hypothetical protein [Chitinophagaceae bacterium]HMU24002.1 hypothetical protein [Ferruginibacter sp.]
MPQTYPIEWPVFFTSTIYQWKPVLEKDHYKDINALSGHPAIGLETWRRRTQGTLTYGSGKN